MELPTGTVVDHLSMNLRITIPIVSPIILCTPVVKVLDRLPHCAFSSCRAAELFSLQVRQAS